MPCIHNRQFDEPCPECAALMRTRPPLELGAGYFEPFPKETKNPTPADLERVLGKKGKPKKAK